jgi:hypothetical protein
VEEAQTGPRPTNTVILVTAALVLAGTGVVLIAIGAASDSKAALVAAAVAIGLALVPILWWRGVLISEWHSAHPEHSTRSASSQRAPDNVGDRA